MPEIEKVAVLEVPKNFNRAKKVLGGNNGSARRKRFAKCGHLGFGQFCHRCATADLMEKTGKEAQHKAVSDPKALAERVAKLRAVPGVVVSPAAAKEVIVVAKKESISAPEKPRLTEKEKALKGFNPLPSLGKAAEEETERMKRINANALALSEG